MFIGNNYIEYRLLITSVVLAIKFNDDQYFTNKHYSRIGGISCRELNKMENRFLKLINYNLHINTEVFEQYSIKLTENLHDKRIIIEEKKEDDEIIVDSNKSNYEEISTLSKHIGDEPQ